jgi:hypothetical protein
MGLEQWELGKRLLHDAGRSIFTILVGLASTVVREFLFASRICAMQEARFLELRGRAGLGNTVM